LAVYFFERLKEVTLPVTLLLALAAVSFSIAPIIVIMCSVTRDRVHAVISVILLTAFFAIITFGQIGPEFSSRVSGGLLIILSLVIFAASLFLLLVAPAKAVSRRLIFLALGLLLLVALNELSKLGLDVTAPKLQG
jgi:hypothetical protein